MARAREDDAAARRTRPVTRELVAELQEICGCEERLWVEDDPRHERVIAEQAAGATHTMRK
jgi:hypothetical protein